MPDALTNLGRSLRSLPDALTNQRFYGQRANGDGDFELLSRNAQPAAGQADAAGRAEAQQAGLPSNGRSAGAAQRLGWKAKTALAAGGVLALAGLGVGLGVGLTRKHGQSNAIPGGLGGLGDGGVGPAQLPTVTTTFTRLVQVPPETYTDPATTVPGLTVPAIVQFTGVIDAGRAQLPQQLFPPATGTATTTITRAFPAQTYGSRTELGFAMEPTTVPATTQTLTYTEALFESDKPVVMSQAPATRTATFTIVETDVETIPGRTVTLNAATATPAPDAASQVANLASVLSNIVSKDAAASVG